ncbi:MAG TPA: hypothetical protein VFR38_05130 [Gaiellaceae bacterium]|nr:hypothetical protein [Gaiellaceae bacterium]
MLPAIRPDDWNYVLLLHVGGAMILVGGTLTAASALGFARGDVRLLRLGYWSLLAVGLPGYVLMRIGAEWLASKEGFNEEGAPEPGWLGIGYAVADIGLLLFLIALIVGGIGVRRLRGDKGTRLLKGTMVISIVLLAAYVVAIWAMSGKPD